MTRASLTVRVASRDDVPLLRELWTHSLRRADAADQASDVELIVKAASASPEQRIVVVDIDGRLAGAVHLRISTLSALNLEHCVQAMDPRVFDRFRRHGVGHALMEAAAAFADENGIAHVVTAVHQSSREANRFMARLGLSSVATCRVGATSVLRARTTPQFPQRPMAIADASLSKVIAARRSMRRARAGGSGKDAAAT